MQSFKQFILNESKNTHMEHLEDEIWNEGSAGADNAIDFLKGVADMLTSSVSSSHNVTVKWDGAPAIIAGINPENNKFFVGTKSVFNKGTPKINYTSKDVDKNHSGDLATKLKIALGELPKIGIKGVLQGDFMFDSSSLGSMKIDGKSHTTFTPNTITYAVEDGGPDAREIKGAKMGIVFHTEYKGKILADMKASFRPNIKKLNKNKAVWFRDADFKDESGASTLTTSEKKSVDKAIDNASNKLDKASGFIDNLQKGITPKIKTYINSTIKNGLSNANYKGFVSYITDQFDTAINKLKTDRGKEKKSKSRDDTLEYLKTNKSGLTSLFDLHKALSKAKMLLIRKLEKISSIGTFVRTDDGFKATAPEGFVAVDNTGKALKLVDRLEFSRSNFTVAKNWVKG
jgi:hypothetical protein